MTYLTIHPDYRSELAHAGVHAAEDVLRLDSVIFCGHPGRNVARASLSTRSGPRALLIKREHAVPFRERLANWVHGFGLASKSKREAMTLSLLKAARIPAPEWIAHGEDEAGVAFLVLRECTGAVDMRLYLERLRTRDTRIGWASLLGRDLAALHQAGFDHPDLYSKHILVREQGAVCFIDWQRTGPQKHVGWPARIRALARLNATVEPGLATLKERLSCLAAYLEVCRAGGSRIPDLHSLGKAISVESVRLSKRRRLREQSQVQTKDHEPMVIWRDGEALCLTSELEACLNGSRPAWLALSSLPSAPSSLRMREQVEIGRGESGDLTRRRERSWLQLLSRLTGRHRPSSRDVREAGYLFRLGRLGLRVPRVLAFGQRAGSFGRLESFLLQARPRGNRTLRDWLEASHTDVQQTVVRRRLLREAGSQLRQLHRANFYLDCAQGGQCDEVFAVTVSADGNECVMLDRADLLVSRRDESVKRAHQDLRSLWQSNSGRLLTRTDCLRFLLAYRGAKVVDRPEKTLWNRLAQKRTGWALAARALGLM
jgi:tRNA A-37 threonylcarbamoyl transferase component Bud32